MGLLNIGSKAKHERLHRAITQRSLPNAPEKIGRCDSCGLIDHHLIGGECPSCRPSQISFSRDEEWSLVGVTREFITDERVNYLADRFQANYIFDLQGLTFDEYLQSPEHFDAIADDLKAHLKAGGACHVDESAAVEERIVPVHSGHWDCSYT